MPHSRAKAPERGNGAQTLERGLDLLERVTRDPVGVADLAEDAGLTISTTRRLVAALMDRGFVSLGGKGKLRAGPKLIPYCLCTIKWLKKNSWPRATLPSVIPSCTTILS